MKRHPRPADPQPYHHGNLREALLATALASLRKHGAEQLSLRELARSLGVSQAAPYRHFADKETLLAELTTQGFRELHQDMQKAMGDGHVAPATALQAAGVSYIRFAVRHPELYRLMFGAYRMHKGRHRELDQAATDTFGVLVSVIHRGVGEGTFRNEPVMVLAVAAWSIVHGFASLSIDGELTVPDPADDAASAEQVTRLLHVGLAKP